MAEDPTTPLTSQQNMKHDETDSVINYKSRTCKKVQTSNTQIIFPCLSKDIPWLVLCLLITINIFTGNVYYAFCFFYIEFVEAFNVSSSAAGWVGSIQQFVSMVAGIFFNAPLRQYGHKPIAYSGALLLCCSLVASSFAPNIYVLYIAFGFFAGLGLSAFYLVIAVVSQNEFTKHRSILTTVTFCGYGFGQFISSPLTVYLVNTYGWRGALLLEAGICAQLCVLTSLLPNPNTTQKHDTEHVQCKTERSNVKSILFESFDFSLMKDASYCLYNIGTLLIRIGNTAFVVHMPSKLVHQGISKQEAALLIMIQSVITVPCRLIIGAISDIKKVDKFIVHFIGGTLTVTASFTAAIWSSYTGTVIALVMHALYIAAWPALVPVILVDLLGVENIGRSYAINNLFFGIATLISPPFTGWLFDITKNYEIPYYVNSGIGFVSLIFVFGTYILLRKKRQKASMNETDQPRIRTLSELREIYLHQNDVFTASLERL